MERHVQRDGVTLRALVEGAGPPVLLLHGFPDSALLWRYQIRALVDAGYRVIAPDGRGFGESDAPCARRAYVWRELLDDVVALLEALGIEEPVRVVGHDWGAVVGWLLAIHRPELVDRFVALSVGHPTSYRRGGILQKMKAWYVLLFQIPGLAEWILRRGGFRLLRFVVKNHGEFPRWEGDLSRPGRLERGLDWYRANRSLFLSANFPKAKAHVLGVWSSADFALVERQMTNSSRWVEGSWRYERLDGVGHWIPVDAPEELNALLLRYFALPLPALPKSG